MSCFCCGVSSNADRIGLSLLAGLPVHTRETDEVHPILDDSKSLDPKQIVAVLILALYVVFALAENRHRVLKRFISQQLKSQ